MVNFDLTRLVENKNKALWERVSTEYTIDLEPSPDDTFGCYSQNKNAILYIPFGKEDPDSFTHELLHLDIRSKDVLVGSVLTLTTMGSNILGRIFHKDLIDHIGNCLEHIKMLPVYLDMGYREELFLHDYHVHKCPRDVVQNIAANYKIHKVYNTSAVDTLIGKYFAIMADSNERLDYDWQIKEMRKIDSQLCDAMDKLLDEWDELDINTSEEFPLVTHRTIVFNFYERLKKWMDNKKFV